MMDRRERFDDLTETLLAALDGRQAEICTALPGIIQSYDNVTNPQTCTVQPAIMARVTAQDGTSQFVKLPLLTDVPVMFVGGGGLVMTFPVAQGDEALIIFAQRCIDTWWKSGGYNNVPAELRMHSWSDGFALIGPRSQARKLAGGINMSAAELRNDAGTVKLQIAADGSAVTVVAPSIKLGSGALQKLLNDAFLQWANAHVHTSAAPGSPTTPPTILAAPATMETQQVTAV
jgi:hypothetical protein